MCRIINVEVRVISRAEGEADNSYQSQRIKQLQCIIKIIILHFIELVRSTLLSCAVVLYRCTVPC